MKSINNYIVKEKNVLLRVDLNVPVVNGVITEKSRIIAIKKTLKKLINTKNKVFLISHFGRPNGLHNKKYSLEFICSTLEKELQLNKLHFLNSFDEKCIKQKIKELNFGEVCLIENIRFHPGEENNDKNLSKSLSNNFDLYVNDAFSASHRKHASIVGITKFLPSIAGDSLLDEIKNINIFFDESKKPNLAIIGGSKISTKIDLLNNLSEKYSKIVIGGAMANTFLFAKGINIGESLCEKNLLNVALSILQKAKNLNCEILLPIDVVCANSINNSNSVRHCDVKHILDNHMILDIGNQTIKLIAENIYASNMILWNGPLGAFEYKPFDQGTIEVANIINDAAKKLDILTLAGGGDTISAIKLAKAENGFTYISRAGGAFLECIEGKELPGIKALEDNIMF